MLLSLYTVTVGPDATLLTKQSFPAVIPPQNQAVKANLVAWQTADPVLGNRWPLANKDYLWATNSGDANQTVRLVSAPEKTYGRLGDVSQVIEPGQFFNYGPIPLMAFAQGDGAAYVVSSSTDILLNPIQSL